MKKLIPFQMSAMTILLLVSLASCKKEFDSSGGYNTNNNNYESRGGSYGGGHGSNYGSNTTFYALVGGLALDRYSTSD